MRTTDKAKRDFRWSSRTSVVLACLSTFLMSALPLALVIGANAGTVPLDRLVIMRALTGGFVGTAILLWALRLFQRDLATRAIWLSWVLAPISIYGQAIASLHQHGIPVEPGDLGPAVLYTLAAFAVATVFCRPWQVKNRDPMPFIVLATVLLAANIYQGVSSTIGASAGSWRSPADALIESAQSPQSIPPRPAVRDIYYVVLDGFGRADTLHQYYDLDLTSFLAFLRAKGFYVADAAQSNYSQTFLALGSAMNLGYIDDVAAAIHEGGSDRRPMQYLIAHNALMNMAKHAGYQVIGIGSDYMATKELDAADICVCEQHGLDEIEQTTIELTPLAALPLGRWNADAHRRKVIDGFAALDRAGSSSERTFVFAHIISPHPPFVFAPDGSSRLPRDSADIFRDGDHYRGTKTDYVRGYHDQVQFLTRRLMSLIESLLSRPGPAPVIVFHGDHGPGSMLQWERPAATNLRERMTIFAAYYFPDGPALYPTITPINGARALANGYLGAQLQFLPDRSSFSRWSRPYDFTPVAQLPPLSPTSEPSSSARPQEHQE